MWGEGSGRCDDLHVSSVYVPDIRPPGERFDSDKVAGGGPQISPRRRKTFPGKVRGTADPSASLGMTKERATFLWKVVSEPKAFGSSHHFPCNHNPPLCHPERSRGICSSADLSSKCYRQSSVRIGGDRGHKLRHVFKRLGFHATGEHGLKCVA